MNEHVPETIKELFESLGIQIKDITELELAGQSIINLEIEGPTDHLIGSQGDTLRSIDYLVKKIVEQKRGGDEDTRSLFLVDINGNRAVHIKELQTRAKVMAERARSFQYNVELPPMSSYERLIVHATLTDQPNIKTESQGEGKERRIVIKYTN